MKIKLVYPKIPDTLNCPLKQCIAFEKIDGTNIHFVGNPYEGWTHFGTRRDRFPLTRGGIQDFESTHSELSGVSCLWDTDYSLRDYFHTNLSYGTYDEIIVFTEYHGPNSFAGSHQLKDPKQLTLLDVQVNGKLLPPQQFAKDFIQFNIPKLIFQGKFTGQLFVDVRKGKYDVKEGVVVKGIVDGEVYMAKIKTQRYLDQLKEKFGDKWKEYGE